MIFECHIFFCTYSTHHFISLSFILSHHWFVISLYFISLKVCRCTPNVFSKWPNYPKTKSYVIWTHKTSHHIQHQTKYTLEQVCISYDVRENNDLKCKLYSNHTFIWCLWRQNVCIYGFQIVCPRNFSQKQNIGYKNMGHAKDTC